MPEGDTIFRAARTLREAMAGRVVTRFESVFPHLNRIHEDTPVTARTVEDVTSAGKHLLFRFSGGLVLRSHLRMNGRWHVYRTGERWQRPRSAMRVVVGTDAYEAVGFDLVDVSFHSARTLLRDSTVGTLGPDLLRDDFDEVEALRRLRAPPDVDIATALLDQWRLAGIGNVYKSETLFLCGVAPFRRVSDVSDGDLERLVRKARVLMRANVGKDARSGIVTYRGLRRTTGRANPEERVWVYGRAARPCRKCGTMLRSEKRGPAARTTYWCPQCQGEG